MQLTKLKLKHISILKYDDIDKLSENYNNLKPKQKEKISKIVYSSYNKVLSKYEKCDFDKLNEQIVLPYNEKMVHEIVGIVGMAMSFALVILASIDVLEFTNLLAGFAFAGLGLAYYGTVNSLGKNAELKHELRLSKHPLAFKKANNVKSNLIKARAVKYIV
ncbi:MAG: hypothetical protein J5626_10270, partial [Lachnospiraceae bacterium]|nr:hypothetical protein [Lachnospiraceae bacterium]